MFSKKLLLAYDGTEGSQLALAKTILLAKRNPELIVHIVYVNRPPKTMVGVGEAYMIKPLSLEPEVDQEMITQLKRAESQLSAYVTCSTEIVVDEIPEREILEQRKRFDCDLIVIGSRSLRGVKKLFLGSVSKYIVNHSPVPVLVVK